jgi:serine/threonine protein kinase
MGKVYEARDTVMGRDVAIKVLPAELGAEPEYRRRFRREAHTAARLAQPHIIPIYDAGEIDGRLYLAMPIIDGIDLDRLLQRDGPMSPARAVHITEQLAGALDAAHAVGLVHRDVKPSNALVTRQDLVYLIDFGLAHNATATKLTSAGTIMGSLNYMAPERFTDGVADARSDIYALACVLHECLTGDQPYPGDSLEQQLAGHLSMEPPRPSEDRAGVPVGFDDVIASGMAKDPDQRYQSAHQLAEAARQALTTAACGTPHAAARPRANPTRLRQRPIPLSAQVPADPGASSHHAAAIPQPAPAPKLPEPLVARPIPAPRRPRRPSPIAVVVLSVTILGAGIMGIAGYLSRPHPKTPSAPTAAPSGPQAVAQAALPGLLLSPDQLGTALGAPG